SLGILLSRKQKKSCEGRILSASRPQYYRPKPRAITNHQTRALNAFPRPRGQNPRSGRWSRFTGIYGGQTTMLHDPKCRFDYLFAPIRLYHTDLFSLDCPSRTPPINTKFKPTFKGFKYQTKSLPQSKLYFPTVLAHPCTTASHPKEGRHVLMHIPSDRSTMS
ncbi:unnamed protein product, partial [Prunus brigantina]